MKLNYVEMLLAEHRQLVAEIAIIDRELRRSLVEESVKTRMKLRERREKIEGILIALDNGEWEYNTEEIIQMFNTDSEKRRELAMLSKIERAKPAEPFKKDNFAQNSLFLGELNGKKSYL